MSLSVETLIAYNYLEEHGISGVITEVTENWFEYSHEGKRHIVAFSNIL